MNTFEHFNTADELFENWQIKQIEQMHYYVKLDVLLYGTSKIFYNILNNILISSPISTTSNQLFNIIAD